MSVRRGESHPHHTLTERAVLDMRERYAAGDSPADLAAAYGVHVTTVRGIVKHRTWQHVGGPRRVIQGATTYISFEWFVDWPGITNGRERIQ